MIKEFEFRLSILNSYFDFRLELQNHVKVYHYKLKCIDIMCTISSSGVLLICLQLETGWKVSKYLFPVSIKNC